MGWYKLVPSPHAHAYYDEVKFLGDEDKEKTVSLTVPVELSDEEVSKLNDLGHQVLESAPPKEEDYRAQQVGVDVTGMSPIIGASQPQQTPSLSQADQEQAQQEAQTASPGKIEEKSH